MKQDRLGAAWLLGAWLACALLTGAGPVWAAENIQRWVDAQGRVHFGDRPPANVRSERVVVRPNVYTSPRIEPVSLPRAEADAVVLYSTSWCGYCRKARAHLRARRIRFVEYDVETSAKGRADFRRLGGGGVPVILVGDKRLNGFSVDAFEGLYASRRGAAPS